MINRGLDGRFKEGSGLINLTGKRFGKLQVVGFGYIQGHRSYWKCRCDCGTEKYIRGDSLKRICSCGCEKKKQDTINLHITNGHGMTHHIAYNCWSNMIDRCFDSSSTAYKDYGGRGITVCSEWLDVGTFCKWAEGNNYKRGDTIERINVNGNYEPSNCKLIPMREQALNRRDSVFIMLGDKRVYLAKEAYRLGIDYGKVKNRYKRGVRDYDTLFYFGDLRGRGR